MADASKTAERPGQTMRGHCRLCGLSKDQWNYADTDVEGCKHELFFGERGPTDEAKIVSTPEEAARVFGGED